MARAVKRRAAAAQKASVYDDEVSILALILKENYKEDKKCKEELNKYCENLKKIDLKDEQIHSKLKDLCDTGKQDAKCQEMKTKVKGQCDKLKTKLETLVSKPSQTNDECIENEQQCLFLEGACSGDLTENCNKLRNKCYQKKRDEVANEVLLRALNGNLKDKNACERKLKELCPKLGQESNELAQKCFDTDSTCGPLVKEAEEKCKSLKTDVGKVIKPNGELEEKGYSLLEKCYFYEENCKDPNKPECEKLVNKTKKKKIIYKGPDSDFDLTRPEATVAEKIGLEELYKEAAAQGIVIQKALERDILDLLVYLSKNDKFDKDQCKKVLNDKCNSIQYLAKELEILCKNKTGYDDKCEEFKNKFEEIKVSLTAKFKNKHFEEEITLWGELPSFLTENDCIRLQSDCFYFEGQTDFQKQCRNVKAACYKRGLDVLANQALQDKMRGKFHYTNDTWLETLQKELVKVCVDLKGTSNELFVLCVKPIEGANAILMDLYVKIDLLQEDLNEKRDFPTKQDCKELLKKCNDLRQDSEELEWPCHTLKHHCNRLEIAGQLEEKLLEEKTENLDKFDSCLKNLKKQCHEWNRRGRTQFALACVAQNITCRILTESVGSKCTTLGERIKASNIINQIKKNNEKESTCNSWTLYCSKFMSSCHNLTTAGGGKCEKLNKECKSFIERKELELKVVDQLKGHLDTKEKCKGELDKYCTQWVNASNGLETLCKKNAKEDNQVKEELCEKLVKYVKRQCPVLKLKLTKASEELPKKKEDYEKLKTEAVKAMNEANLVLSKAKATDDKSAGKTAPPVPAAPSGSAPSGSAPVVPNTTQNTVLFKLVRRNINAPVTEKTYVTEKELKAFDLVSQAFSLYVELKELCHDSEKGCGFKEECKDIEEACTKIEKTCGGLKPLEIKPHEIVTKNVTTTTTTTTTTTVKDVKATDCQSLQTTDTWVTKTSTHTSTSTTTSTVTSRITLTSTRRCKPTKCTTGEEDEAGELKPSEGLRMNGWSVMRGVLVAMMISFMI